MANVRTELQHSLKNFNEATFIDMCSGNKKNLLHTEKKPGLDLVNRPDGALNNLEVAATTEVAFFSKM